jgi:hypothetical protein
MCDCYEHPCAVNGCPNTIPWHIGDYKFSRDCFAIWCPDHVDAAPKYARYFEITEDPEDRVDCPYPRGTRIAAIGPEIGLGEDGGDNTLNIVCDPEYILVIVSRMPAEQHE